MSVFYQKEIKLSPLPRGFHLISEMIVNSMPEIQNIQCGMLHVFLKHTSAALCINENWDATVRGDFERHFNQMVPENASYYEHTYEGSDDMPAHIKSAILGVSLSIPITDGKLNLGTWQGIYLCEHRNNAEARKLVLSAWGSFNT